MTQERPDPELLIQSMHVLSDGLTRIARTYDQYIYLDDEGDPERFSPGHFVLLSEGQDHALFAIEEQYTGTDWSDPDRLPTSWTWHTQRVVHHEGRYRWTLEGHGEVAYADIVQLLARARTWARQESEKARRETTSRDMPHQPWRPDRPSL